VILLTVFDHKMKFIGLQNNLLRHFSIYLLLCSMNVIRMYYIRHCNYHVTYTSFSCVASLPFTNPLPVASWDDKVSVGCVL